MKVERFEDLIAWQKARELVKAIYAMTKRDGAHWDLAMVSQIQRSAVSVMSNLAEGFERGSRREFARFSTIAKASCAELRSLLYVLFDIGYIKIHDFDEMMRKAHEVARVVGGLRASLAGKG